MDWKENKNLKVILYISVWVIIWGSVGSLIDYPLYKAEIYSEGSISVSYTHLRAHET